MVMSEWDNSIFLVDANYIAYRGVYGLFQAPITEIENAMLYSFMKTLVSIGKGIKVGDKQRLKPSNMILCWDSKHNYRKMLYPPYKKKPNNLTDHQERVLDSVRVTFPRLREWMSRINIPGYIFAGYEADDVIAAFTKQFKERFIIITRDEDLYQLLDERVSIYKMVKGEKKLYTVDTFTRTYGVEPRAWAYIKALGGCTSDNIPGLQGIGEKTAVRIVSDGHFTPAIAGKIADSQDKLRLFERLTRLPLDNRRFEGLSIEKKEPNWDAFTNFCQIYNFKKLIVEFKKVKEALT